MDNKFFTFSNKIVLSILFFNLLAVTEFHLTFYSEIIVYCANILIFIIVTLLNADIKNKIKITASKFNIITIVSAIILSFFTFSTFVKNLSVNLSIIPLLKISTYLIIFYYYYFYLPKLFFLEHELFEKFLSLIMNTGIIMSVISVILFFSGINIHQKTDMVPVGLFYYDNIFAFVYTFTIPILIYKRLTGQLSLAYFISALLLSSVVLLFTFSRAGYLGVLLSVLIIIYKKSKKLFFTVLIFILIISATFVFDFAKAKGSMSAITRVQVMLVAYDMIMNNGSDKFLWGYGVFNSKKVFVNNLTSTFEVSREETGPHNFIFTLGIQFGMALTASVLILLLTILIKTIIKNKKYYKHFDSVNLCLAVISGLLVQCMLEDIVVYPEFFVMPIFLLFLGYLKYFLFNKGIPKPEKSI